VEAEGSWVLPTSGTAHKPAERRDASVSRFLRRYLEGSGIKASFLSKLCKIMSIMKRGGQFTLAGGRTDFLIRIKL